MTLWWTILLICITTYSSSTTGNYWSEWSAWSECSRTCNGGATYQTRRCVRSRSYRMKCLGKAIRYSTCNNVPCPPGLPDFRTEQCAAYDDASYSGRYFRWMPYDDKGNPCALTCIAEGTKLVAVLAPKVLDGTRCNTHSLDMCINGECRAVGCDHVLGSSLVMDSCGVCGGNNTCGMERRSVTATEYRWVETGFGPCSVTCGIGVKEKRLLCFDTYRGKILDAENCDDVIRPTDTRTTCSIGTCPPEWRVGPWQNCTRDCGGGVSWRIVTCVQTFEDGTQQLVRDSTCSNLRPSSRKSCNGYICPTWYAGEWSICSVSCGTGIQKREVICRHVGESFCRDADKPRTMKNCTTGISCYNLNGDIQERHVGEFRVDGGQPQNDQAITREDLYKPRFVPTTWGACSATCGEGVKFRYVRCQVFLKYLDDFVDDLPDEDCKAEVKPDTRAPCMVEPCYDQYMWKAMGMTDCSVTCLGGIQETILKCVVKENETLVSDDFCVEAPLVPTERRICNDRPCPQRWDLGEYGGCSASCGGGQMSRTVKCIQEISHGPRVITLPDVLCSRPRPANQSACNVQSCPAHWAVGNWTKCSVSCGLGVQLRKPLCQRLGGNKIENVSLSNCDKQLKPDTQRTCNISACPAPMIKTKNVKFFQLDRISRLRLLVGMEASVLPETNIIIKCPNVGLDRQKTIWFKNGLKLKPSKRARVARSGALRIKHARPGVDNGVYSCFIGGLEANVSIKFHSGYEILQARLIRDQFLPSPGRSAFNLMNGSYMYQDPVDRKNKALVLMSTEWTRCSVTCGGGLQSRNMTCEIITEDYYLVVNKEDCFKHLTIKPLLIQSCNTVPCVRWRAGNWSECSDQECVRSQYAMQRRPVDCVNAFNDTLTEDRFCQELKFPPDNVRDCPNLNCTAEWSTSKWAECNAPCDEFGTMTRTLSCIWGHTRDLAPPGGCDKLEQPKTSRRCKGVSCEALGEAMCEDESDYCSIIKVMNMCKYSNFSVRCCWTCNEDYYYYDEVEGEAKEGEAGEGEAEGDAEGEVREKEGDDAVTS